MTAYLSHNALCCCSLYGNNLALGTVAMSAHGIGCSGPGYRQLMPMASITRQLLRSIGPVTLVAMVPLEAIVTSSGTRHGHTWYCPCSSISKNWQSSFTIDLPGMLICWQRFQLVREGRTRQCHEVDGGRRQAAIGFLSNLCRLPSGRQLSHSVSGHILII